VQTDEACCRHYFLFMRMQSLTERMSRVDGETEVCLSELRAASLLNEATAPTVSPRIELTAAGTDNLAPYSAVPGPVSTGYFASHPFQFAYLVASVFFVIGLVIGSLVHVSRDESLGDRKFARQNIDSDPAKQTPAYNMQVGRVSGMSNCVWSDPKIQMVKDAPVYLGRTFVLSSGLLEITYNSNAKVILQGPCIYRADSPRSGFLEVGKLTAKVESGKGSGARGQDSENPKSPNPQTPKSLNPLFAIASPIAVVTDLGTEFGVEVDKQGTTTSHVFKGKIEVRAAGSSAQAAIVTADESATVRTDRGVGVKVTRNTAVRAEGFVRAMPRTETGPLSTHLQTRQATPDASSFYRFTDLGTLGGQLSRAYGISALGQVVGESAGNSGRPRAFLYAEGIMKPLGTLGGDGSSALGINRSGVVVGKANNAQGVWRAFVYANGEMKDLGTPGDRASSATSVNDRGEIVGAFTNSDGVERAFFYSGGKVRDIGSLGGPNASSRASAINNSSIVVGYSLVNRTETRSFVFSPNTGMKEFEGLLGRQGVACGVNASGSVVGFAAFGQVPSRAFLVSEGSKLQEIGSAGSPKSFALGVNDAGEVVGAAEFAGSAGPRAFLFKNGKLIDLNSQINFTLGWTLQNATAINDSGEIVGSGLTPRGKIHAFLLTPIDAGGKK
jgi:probable HAF family extracellular repeat protein